MKEGKIRQVKVLHKNNSFQKCVVLKDDDSFIDDESVVVSSLDNDKKFQHEFEKSKEKINSLQNELLEEKNKLIKSQEEIQALQSEISKIDQERIDIYQELDYKNKVILAYNVEMNQAVFDVVENVIDEARHKINERNLELVNEINRSIEKTKLEVNERNKAIAFDINQTVDATNEEIRNTSLIKMILNKNKINLKVSTNDIIRPFEFQFDPNELISSKTLEIDSAEIIKRVMPKISETSNLYIESSTDNDEIIEDK